MPLAIELAAARTRVLSIPEIELAMGRVRRGHEDTADAIGRPTPDCYQVPAAPEGVGLRPSTSAA